MIDAFYNLLVYQIFFGLVPEARQWFRKQKSMKSSKINLKVAILIQGGLSVRRLENDWGHMC